MTRVVRHEEGETTWAVEERLRAALDSESVVDLDEVLQIVLATVLRARGATVRRLTEEATLRAERARLFLEAHGRG